MRLYVPGPYGDLDREVAWVRRYASRDDWKFKRGRGRLKARPVWNVRLRVVEGAAP